MCKRTTSTKHGFHLKLDKSPKVKLKSLRITAGCYRGTISTIGIKEPLYYRPTTGKVRSILFNTLFSYFGNSLEGLNFLDLCSGSGACGLEALSWGFSKATFVDINDNAIDLGQRNSIKLGIAQDSCHFINKSVEELTFVPEHLFSVIYIDPPYDLVSVSLRKCMSNLIVYRWLLPGAILVIEGMKSRSQEIIALMLEFNLRLLKQKACNITQLLFFVY